MLYFKAGDVRRIEAAGARSQSDRTPVTPVTPMTRGMI
jgi:hypothetical protein